MKILNLIKFITNTKYKLMNVSIRVENAGDENCVQDFNDPSKRLIYALAKYIIQFCFSATAMINKSIINRCW